MLREQRLQASRQKVLVRRRRFASDSWIETSARDKRCAERFLDQPLRLGNEVVDHQQRRALAAEKQSLDADVGVEVEDHGCLLNLFAKRIQSRARRARSDVMPGRGALQVTDR